MPSYTHRYSLAAISAMTLGLAGCGSEDKSLEDFGIETSSPLICKTPQTINAAGTACELVVSPCNFPEVPDESSGLCVEFTGPWPEEGANDIVMPEPVYMAQAKAGGGFEEVVYYYNREAADFDGWGLHAWNNSDCGSYAQFDLAEGGTDWGIPIEPMGVDPNFGIYWALDIIDVPNCTNFIPYGFEIDNGNTLQTNDLSVDLSSAETNPTGNFYVLARNAADPRNTGTIFPYPRTFASLIVPGGSTPPPLECTAPEVLNEEGTECLAPVIEEFVPGEVTLFLRGTFNDWGTDENLIDAVAFHYADNTYTATVTLDVPAEGDSHNFKIADKGWSEATSFGAFTGEETVTLDEAKILYTGKDANGEDIEQNMSVRITEPTSLQVTIDASDPTAPELTVTQVPLAAQLYIRGSMNDWGNVEDEFGLASGVTAMRYQGDNLYSAEIMLEAADTSYGFKIADAGWISDTNFGAADGDEMVTFEVAKTLALEGNDLSFTVDETAVYKFSLDVTDPMMPVLTVGDALPFELGTKLYLRGSFNGWGNDGDNFALTDADAFHYADGIYTSTLSLTAESSPYNFKIASAGWEENTSFGGVIDDTEVTVGTEGTKTLLTPLDDGTENLTVSITEDSNLQFTLDVTNPESPQLSVLSAPLANAIYIRGSMNGWANDGNGNFSLESGTKVLRYQGGTLYTVELALPADNHAFKIADAAWSDDTNFGGPDGEPVIVLAEPKTLTVGGGPDMTFENAEAATYLISVDVAQADAPIFWMTEKAPFGSDSLYLRGSMVGWENPSNTPLTYTGNGVYSIDFFLEEATSHNFKIAGADWATTTLDFGAPALPGDPVVILGESKTLVLKNGDGSNENLQFVNTASGNFIFEVNATDTNSPTLTVTESN